jgi:hypothetical protein
VNSKLGGRAAVVLFVLAHEENLFCPKDLLGTAGFAGILPCIWFAAFLLFSTSKAET